jgi:disulfide bond formation protein DsbB
MYFVSQLAGRGSRRVNTLALLAVSAMLFFSLAWQFLMDDYACATCTLQRAILALAGMGLLLNVRLGPSPLHYVMTIATSLAGASVSAWQVLQPPEEDLVRLAGLQFDSWAFLSYSGLVAFSLLMLALDRKWGDNNVKLPLAVPATVVMSLFLVAVLCSAAGPLLDCGGVSACLPSPQALAALGF